MQPDSPKRSKLKFLIYCVAAAYVAAVLAVTAYLYYFAFSRFWGFNVLTTVKSDGTVETSVFYGMPIYIGYALMFVGPLFAGMGLLYCGAYLWFLFGRVVEKRLAAEAEANRMGAVEQATLRALLRVSLADGEVEASEIQTITELMSKLIGTPPADAALRRELAYLSKTSNSLEDDVGSVLAPLNQEARVSILRCAIRVALANASLHEGEWGVLARLSSALMLPQTDHEKVMRQELAQHSA